jgi:hypothetical protein
MRPGEGEFEDLRLAAKAADRTKAAEQQWPAFEKRLRELGYSPLAIAEAFSALSSGSVAEALEVLRAPRPESHPVPLTFEVTEASGWPWRESTVTITSVEHDGPVIQVNYGVLPPPDLDSERGSRHARCEAKDDLGNDYGSLGEGFGISGHLDSTGRANTRAHGRLRVPLPPPPATMLRIRIRWEASGMIRMPWEAAPPSIWNGPAHEVRVALSR